MRVWITLDAIATPKAQYSRSHRQDFYNAGDCHCSVIFSVQTINSKFKKGATMNQRIFTISVLAASISALTIPVLAQAQTTRIEELQQRERGTTVSGEVLSVVGNDFVLSDGTGEIIVDAGPTWWHNIDVEPGEQVTVTGEVSKKSNELDAFSITRSDGSTIDIRPADGPPPWAGSRHRGRESAPRPLRERIRQESRQRNISVDGERIRQEIRQHNRPEPRRW
jgi:Bacterial OB fold (BOF) protein